MPRPLRRLLVVAGTLIAFLVAGFTVATGAQAAAGCRVTYTVPSQWPGGFTADVRLTNLGPPVTGWHLTWAWPSGQRVTQAWNATVTASGAAVTATNVSWNATLATNATAGFGLNGSWTGANPAPASFALNGVPCTSPGPTPTPSQPAGPMATVAAMEPGWNLGNTLDAIPDETAWGNPLTTRELLRHVRGQGYNSIRLPVTWSNHHGPAPDYTIDAAWLARVRQIVDWSLDEGFYVMINLHHDSWQWLNVTPTDTARYTALWGQIADEFRDHSPRLVFESINEPQFAGTADDAENYRVLAGLNATFVGLVRDSGGGNATRLLVLPTLHTNADQGRLDALLTEFDALDDPNLAATVHFYGYWPFSVNIAGGTRYDATVEADLTGTFDRVHDTFVARGIPVIIGEWALLNWDHNRPGVIERGEFLKFLEAVGHHARIRRLTTMLWDAGQFLDRRTLTWRDQGVYDMMRASWTTRSATASADQIYLPGTGAIPDRSLTLNLNGLTFTGLTGLRAGTDYTVSGSTLTLTAAALTRLAGDRAYGVNGSVEARFSAGVPWRIDVITADPPVQSAATGTTTAFAVPTRFRGDQLATMEARYADGTPAGPANWTSYKEFWQHFQPDYATGRILLKPEFFAEVTDGPVTLTFHFWSGARTTYRLERSGTSITGTPA